MEGLMVGLFVLAAIAVLFGGAICGIVSVFAIRTIREEHTHLELRVKRSEKRLEALDPGGTSIRPPDKAVQPAAATPSKPVSEEVPVPSTPPAPVPPPEPSPVASLFLRQPAPEPSTTPERPAVPPVPPCSKTARGESNAFEVMLGTKWLAWGSMLLVLVAVGLGLKYAYDNNIIGPQGRLAIGALGGLLALGLGEYCRRRDWRALFQTLTGGGIAIFYICIFFAFQIYTLAGQGASMGLAVLVTLLAVVLAVAHDALPIAILAVIGGFLSPVLLSTHENHPYAFFSYIALLDLVALGSAYFRRWRALDLLCFMGTAIMYHAWYYQYCLGDTRADQLAPAMVFTTVFYLLFLLIPTFYSMVRREANRIEGLPLIVMNAIVSFYGYWQFLYADHRQMLGFVALGQALLVFALFKAWVGRVGGRDRTGEALLVIALALVIAAVPLQLTLYGIALAWAFEGALFIYLGLLFQNRIVRGSGMLGLLLAAGTLFYNLPLHTERFTPVFNLAFGSWGAVIAAVALAAWWLYRQREADHPLNFWAAGLSALLALVLACLLLTLELSLFWDYAPVEHAGAYRAQSLLLLWTAIPVGIHAALRKFEARRLFPLSLVAFGYGLMFFMWGLGHYDYMSGVLFFNQAFLSQMLFIAALWWVSATIWDTAEWPIRRIVETCGHILLTILLAVEMVRWADSSDLLSEKMGISLISAVWAVQAVLLIWFGLVKSSRTRRYLGFGLFAITAFKVLFFDTSTLDEVYRIVSFLATGVLGLAGALFYARYSQKLLNEGEPEDEQ